MLLDRIDIDNHGPLKRVELGPLTEGLNVVCTPEGSGKTALVRFIRDSLVRREYPLGMMSSSAGRVVWADRNGKIHCRREHDGTAHGRQTVEFESRGERACRFDWLHGSWIDAAADSSEASRALESIRIPESIVDGVLTDTAVTSVSRVIQACLRSGLTDPTFFAELPRNPSHVSGLSPAEPQAQRDARRRLRDELARVEAELATLEPSARGATTGAATSSLAATPLAPESGQVAARRATLCRRLEELRWLRSKRSHPGHDHAAAADELVRLQERIWQLRVRHGQLSRWLTHLQSDRNRVRYTAPITASPYAHHANTSRPGLSGHRPEAQVDSAAAAAHWHAPLEPGLRERLRTMDAQLASWRSLLAELDGLRDVLHGDADRDAVEELNRRQAPVSVSDEWLHQRRMSYFLAALDRCMTRFGDQVSRPLHPHVFAPTGRAADRSSQPWPDEIDLRIQSLVDQIEDLARRYDTTAGADAGALAASLKSVGTDLMWIRRSGFRLANAAAPGAATALGETWQGVDFERTRHWMRATIERLLSQRNHLVRDHHLANLVHYPNWMDKACRPGSWSAWYVDHLEQETIRASRHWHQVAEELDRCLARALHLRRRMHAAAAGADPFAPPSGAPASGALANAPLSGSQDDAVAREIDWILEQLRWLDHAASTTATRSPRHEWLLRRRDELHEQLGVAEPKGEGNNPLADEASQWLVRLSAGRLRRVDWNHEDFTTDPQQMALAARGGLARIDGNPESGCPAADRALAALAVRLAAADLLARSGRSIPLVIEAQRELLRPLPAGEGELPAKPQAGDVAFPPASVSGELSLAVIAALDDYSQPGRQVIVLASDAAFADQAARRGGRVFHIHGERITHPHRPLWKPHYDRESYVGPYGTTPPAPSQQAPAGETDLWSRSDVLVDRYHDQYFDQMPVGASLAEINRNLDQIWQEAYGVAPETAGSPAAATTKSAHARGDLPGAPGVAPGVAPGASPVAGDWPELGPMPFADDFARPGGLPGTGGLAQAGRGPGMNPLPPVHPDATGGPVEAATAHWHDGYFFADTYTTAPRHSASPHRSAHPRGSATGRRGAAGAAEHAEPSDAGWDDASSPPGRRRVSSPFFLTVDSPIDQAPSVDAVAASRLRRLDVSHINHLMTQDPNRLADALGLANVTAATIRRWQAECRLVCHVPQLRGFDARILVGCGIRDAEQLAGTNPNDLLDRVEAFLATERGQQILLSGTSYELSRITSWIAAANMDTEQLPLAGTPDQQTIDGRVLQGQERGGRVAVASQPASEFQFVDDHGQVVRVRSTRSRRGRPAASGEMAGGQADDRGPARAHRSRAGKPSGRGGNAHTRRRAVESRPSSPRRSRNETTGAQAGATPRRTQRSRLDSADGNAETEANHASNTARRDRSEDHGEADLRFYLHRDSAVVDAPSIGARMAERLRAVGVVTVDDLLSSDPDELAEQLDHRRIDAAVIAGWQHQAILVCRIPMLRGHDAQLLVAAEITTPEEVAEYEAEDLLALVDPIARSNEGKRILRGGKRPDLDEVREWIHYARQHRELVAA